jgi:hypothetical protein
MSLETLTVVGVVVLVVMVVVFLRVRSNDLTEEKLTKLRPGSRVASRAVFLEGMNRFEVALALVDDRLCYQNADIDACLELPHIEEVEYDDETATGHAETGRVLRLRSHGHAFEFALTPAVAKQWEAALPPRTMDAGAARAV